MLRYIAGAISMLAFGLTVSLAADYVALPGRILVTMLGGPFLALALWCWSTARWESKPPSRDPRPAWLPGDTRWMLLYAALSFVLYSVAFSLVPEFSAKPTRFAAAMVSGPFLGIAIIYFMSEITGRRRRAP